MTFLLLSILITPLAFGSLAHLLPDGRARAVLGPVATGSLIAWLLFQGAHFTPTGRLLAASLWLLYTIKGWSLLLEPRSEVRRYSRLGLFLYSYLWPGVDPRPFARQEKPDTEAASWFVNGFPTMCLGIATLALLALWGTGLGPLAQGLPAVLSLLTIVHLGYSDILSSAMRLLGFPVMRLFHFPLAFRTLDDFWTHRWNRPFVEMNRRLFKPMLRPFLPSSVTIFSLFVLSGLLHEFALSYPPGTGFGGPLLYFVAQGIGLRAEKKIADSTLRRLFAWLVLLAPMPLLFHRDFLETLVLPLLAFLRTFPPLSDVSTFWVYLLTAAGYGHFLVLVASFQVPHRLNWGEELQRLRPLNRKLLWTYGGYIATFILLWGVITLNLIPEMLSGEKGALVITGVIALFWWSRIFVDAFYFKHSDWPEGVEFVLGHTMLTTLFVTLASVYSAVLIRAFILVGASSSTPL